MDLVNGSTHLKASIWAVNVVLNKTLNIRLKHNHGFCRLHLWECININNTQLDVYLFIYTRLTGTKVEFINTTLITGIQYIRLCQQ